MKTTHSYFARGLLLGSFLLLVGCPPPNGPKTDTTPPEFVQVVAQLEALSQPNPRGVFDITSADVTRQGLASDLVIRVVATAGDPQSAIKKIALESNLTWQCSFGPNSSIIGIVENAPLTFTPINPPSSPVSPLQINVVASPISQTGCDMSSPGKGPINIRGFVRAVATNGAGSTTTSKTFIFDYADVGSR